MLFFSPPDASWRRHIGTAIGSLKGGLKGLQLLGSHHPGHALKHAQLHLRQHPGAQTYHLRSQLLLVAFAQLSLLLQGVQLSRQRSRLVAGEGHSAFAVLQGLAYIVLCHSLVSFAAVIVLDHTGLSLGRHGHKAPFVS